MSTITKLTVNVTPNSALLICEGFKNEITSGWEVWLKKEGEKQFTLQELEEVETELPSKYLHQWIHDLEIGVTYYAYVVPYSLIPLKSPPYTEVKTNREDSNIVEFDTFPDSRYKGLNPIAHVKEDGFIWENGHKVKK